ncbi:MAG: GAF domain-containing protein, partial [bacterium]|nr:GAF domain-containing protein [bacterium]
MNRVETTAQLRRLCLRAVAQVESAAGAAVSLMSASGPSGIVATSDDGALKIAELQFSLGEGPCWDVFDLNHPVVVEDLSSGSGDRWVAWTAAARSHGVRAALAFPLQVGPTQVGVLDIYRSTPGVLAGEVIAGALALAETATQILLDGQERVGEGSTPTGVDAALEAGLEIYQA